jgi:hypothetical protein
MAIYEEAQQKNLDQTDVTPTREGIADAVEDETDEIARLEADADLLAKQFAVLPPDFRKDPPPIPLFEYRSIIPEDQRPAYHQLLQERDKNLRDNLRKYKHDLRVFRVMNRLLKGSVTLEKPVVPIEHPDLTTLNFPTEKVTNAEGNPRYWLEADKVGSGQMSTVYRAWDTQTKRYVAIKVVKGEGESELPVLKKDASKLEAILGGRLEPYFVRVDNYFQDEEGKLYTVMEYMDPDKAPTFGTYIEQRKAQQKKLPLNTILKITEKMAEGMEVMTRNNVFHNDINPENIFIVKNPEDEDDIWQVKFADLGAEDSVLKAGGYILGEKVMGTFGYVPPEILWREENVPVPEHQRMDVYVLALHVYYLLTGNEFFPLDVEETEKLLKSDEAEYFEYVEAQLRKISQEFLTDQLYGVLFKALDPYPHRRFSSPYEFVSALKAAEKPEENIVT